MIDKAIKMIENHFPKPKHRTESEDEKSCMYEQALGKKIFGIGSYVCTDCTRREAALEIIEILEAVRDQKLLYYILD